MAEMNPPSQPQELTIDKLALGGDALGRIQTAGAAGPAQVVFLPFAAPGDRVTAGRWEPKKNFLRAWVESIQAPSPHRVDAPCPYFFKPGAAPLSVCGGCHWQHLAYEYQLKAKRELLAETLQRIGRIAHPPVEETVGAPDPWRYRNKVQIPFANADSGLVAGFYAPSSHTIVPFDDCLIQTPESVKIFRTALEWMRAHNVKAWDDRDRGGWIRHLLIRTTSAGEALAAFVTGPAPYPKTLELVKHLSARHPALKSVHRNVNPQPGNVILGPEWQHLHGQRHLTETILGLRFRLSPGSFFQVHHAMAEKLYSLAVDFAAPSPEEGVLELYSGVGAIAQLLAPRSRTVWGVEESQQATEDAIASARLNGIKNVRFILGRCETVLGRGKFRGGPGGDLGAVVLDPPRAGCAPHVLRAVMRLTPKRIVYVSCDPGTLARDARYLVTGGYLLRRSVPVDLFPQTSHIESVSLFTRTARPSSPGPALGDKESGDYR